MPREPVSDPKGPILTMPVRPFVKGLRNLFVSVLPSRYPDLLSTVGGTAQASHVTGSWQLVRFNLNWNLQCFRLVITIRNISPIQDKGPPLIMYLSSAGLNVDLIFVRGYTTL